jgi:uncharacterized protein DUF5681
MSWGDGPPDDIEEPGAGYGKPPRATRFTKGRSGNPAGRPRGRHREAPYEAVLGQMVTVREGGTARQVTAAEAFLLQLTKRGLEGDGAATRASLAAIEGRERQGVGHGEIDAIVLVAVAPGSVTSALVPLRMAKKLDPYRETARILFERGSSRLRWHALVGPSVPLNNALSLRRLALPIKSGGPNGGANVRNPK